MPKKFTLFLFLIISLFSCQKPIVFPEGAGPGETAKPGSGTETTEGAIYYVKGNLDGAAVSWIIKDEFNSKWAAGTSARSLRDKGVAVGYNGGSISLITTDPRDYFPRVTIEFGTTKVNFDDDMYSYLKSFLTTGNWNYAPTTDYVIDTKSVIINYTDKVGKEYSSCGAQTGTLKVVSTTLLPATLGRLDGLKVKVEFECKLYPQDGIGNIINFTNAEALIRVESDLY
jgi:hypothetical protein